MTWARAGGARCVCPLADGARPGEVLLLARSAAADGGGGGDGGVVIELPADAAPGERLLAQLPSGRYVAFDVPVAAPPKAKRRAEVAGRAAAAVPMRVVLRDAR